MAAATCRIKMKPEAAKNKSGGKIVISGNWRWPQYEEAFARGLEEIGHEVAPFRVLDFLGGMFGGVQIAVPAPSPSMLRLNSALLEFIKKEKPDIFLAWRCTHVFPATVRMINRMGVASVSYNNDDPFGPAAHGNTPWHHHLLWFWYLRGLRHYRRNFFYRQVNAVEARLNGARHAGVLMPYFAPWRDRPVKLTAEEKRRFGCDVVFVGHYEPDGRVDKLRKLVRSGLSVKLFSGKYWTRKILGDLYPYFGRVGPVYGEDYARALSGAKVCLAFLSRLNRDTYTRRCFEIPACGRVMLAERTKDLLGMFREDEEACFFSSGEELVAKAWWLIRNPDRAEKIAQAGLRRVWADGHDVKSRAAWFMNEVLEAR